MFEILVVIALVGAAAWAYMNFANNKKPKAPEFTPITSKPVNEAVVIVDRVPQVEAVEEVKENQAALTQEEVAPAQNSEVKKQAKKRAPRKNKKG